MKKLTAILLLVILCFNLVGYKLVFNYLGNRANQIMVQQLDKQEYSDADLITVKVPLLLQYFNSWNGFERFDGQIDLEGVHYNYVKRKISNDTLVLLCIPNSFTAKVQTAQRDFFALVNDLQNNGSEKKSGLPLLVSKAISSEYQSQQRDYSIQSLLDFPQSFNVPSKEVLLSKYFYNYPGQPPEVIA